MNKTMSFAKLDFLTVKPYLTVKNLAVILGVFVIIFMSTKNPLMIIGMLMMYCSVYSTTPFSLSERNSIDTLYAALPISKLNVVTGRYIFAISLNIAGGIVSIAISAFIMTIFKISFSFLELAVTALICFVIYTILQAFQLPIFFKMGYSKAKLLSYLPLAVLPASIFILSSSEQANFISRLNSITTWIDNNMALTAIIAFTIWAAIIFVSAFLSCRFYMKREF